MKIHEYQAKAILRSHGVAVPEGRVVHTPEEAARAFDQLGSALAVVKAQIHAGGRGKGGGVKLVRSSKEAEQAACAILAKPLVTHQTGPEGQRVKTLLVEEGSSIKHEFYVGLALDRERGLPVMMVSSEGGVEIEQVARERPDRIHKEALAPQNGLLPYQARRLAKAMGLPAGLWGQAVATLQGLARAHDELDASLAEINPLVLTEEGQLLALDAKFNFDDNGLFRHPEIRELRDLDEEDPAELEAAGAGLSYISLEGNIGCLVNGAGLAMATMDIIKLCGGEPANFLDVGGGADKAQVAHALRLILKDPQVKGILVNIFGGILRCTTLADGLVATAREMQISVPLVVRLEGTEVEEGRRILEEAGLLIITAADMGDAALKVVAAAAGAA